MSGAADNKCFLDCVSTISTRFRESNNLLAVPTFLLQEGDEMVTVGIAAKGNTLHIDCDHFLFCIIH